MPRYRDINKLDDEGLFLEQYCFILRYLRDLVNTNDLDRVCFFQFELETRLNYFVKLKKKILKRKDS